MPSRENVKAMLRAVLLPTFGAMGLLALLLGSVLYYSTSRSDSLAASRQSQLVASALRRGIAAVANDQEASTVWDDAVLRVRQRPLDYDWIDNNLGIWFYTYYAHDEVYILDPANVPIYAMQAGRRVDLKSFRKVSRQASPLIMGLRGDGAGSPVAKSSEGERTIGLLDRTLIAGRPAVVSVKPVISETGEVDQQPGAEYLHISVRYLDGTFLESLSADFGIDSPSFSRSPARPASLPVLNNSGEVIGYVTWAPFEPGEQVRRRMVPAILTALLLVGFFLAWLLSRIWRNRIELEASRTQAEQQALHDPLTGLPNRILLDDRLMHALTRRGGKTPAVVLLDLDRFKNVNDTLGHQAGDMLIRDFGKRLIGLLREQDTIARLGGDEFAVLVEDAGEANVRLLCERILEAVKQPFEILGRQVFVGVSLGVALASPVAKADASELIRRADIALYRSKGNGRNRYTIFTEEMDAAVRKRARIEEDLRKALASGVGLQVHYQPVVDATGARVVGLEALVRWEHPRLGLISADQFVPVAEETGLVDALGEWVMHEACRLSVQWPGRFVAVNLSPAQFHSNELADRLAAIAAAVGADPVQIQLEVPERIIFDDSDPIRTTIGNLRRSGFGVVLDNFGTGYSSLGYLQRFEIDKLKIDKCFVSSIGPAGDALPMTMAILALGEALGVPVAAEGVETPDQQQFLAAAGCMEMQGFLFSRPVPESELAGLLRSSAAKYAAA
jgi:diguanylate cyclase (GGDEF)-like protein